MKIDKDTHLTADLHCDSLEICDGATLYTHGYRIYNRTGTWLFNRGCLRGE